MVALLITVNDKGAAQQAGSDRWPIFVISLADARARRESIATQLQALGLAAEIVDAVDGRRGLPPEMEHLIDRAKAKARMRRRVTDGEFACALSHQGIYRRILDHDLPGAIVLEDDAILTPGFAAFIEQKGYLAADFVQMDHSDARVWRWGRRTLAPGITFHALAANADLATGYSLSAEAARYVLDHSRPLAGVADWPCDLAPLAPVATLPQLVGHPDATLADSDLQAERAAAMEAAKSSPLSKSVASRKPRISRFFTRDYWRRKWWKQNTKRIS